MMHYGTASCTCVLDRTLEAEVKMENGFVNEEDEDYKLFLALHTAALKAARIPPLYWKSLHYKLKHEVNNNNNTAKAIYLCARDSKVSGTRCIICY